MALFPPASEPVTPTELDARIAAEAVDRLSEHAGPSMSVELRIGEAGALESIRLPDIVVSLLSRILTETANGHAVSVIPIEAEMSTQQAADYLNVSRPYVVSLAEQGKIPFHRVGTHRRLRFQDVAEYKKRQDEESYAALAELQAQAQELNMGY
jgi:excisionase family DNA binding protein